MPQTAHSHGDEIVHIGAHGAAAVAAQRYVEIVAEPGGEGDVPAVPELAQVERLVGISEVLFQLESHQGGDTDAQVAVAGEVTVNLQGIAQDAHQVLKTRIGHGVFENPVVVLGDIVGYEEFLEHAHDDEPEADVGAPVGHGRRLLELWQQGAGTGDGACHEQGEEGEVERVFKQARLCGEPPLVYVDGVTDGLERVERYSHRQDDGQRREVGAGEFVENLNEEIGVLVVEQRQQFHCHGEPHQSFAPWPFPLVHLACEVVRQQHGGGQQEHQHPVGLVGEEQAERHHVEKHERLEGVAYGDVEAKKQHEGHGERQRHKRPRFVGSREEMDELVEHCPSCCGLYLW